MAKSNNRHSKFLTTNTLSIGVLSMVDSTFEHKPIILIHKMVDKYNKKILSGHFDVETLNVFFSVLCYEYQYKFNESNRSTVTSLAEVFELSNFMNKVFPHIIKILVENQDRLDESLEILLLDIIVLQIRLYCDIKTINNLFKILLSAKENFSQHHHADNYLYFKFIDCLLDSIYSNLNVKMPPELLDYYTLVLIELNSWFLDAEVFDWKLFVRIISKCIQVFDKKTVFTDLWCMICDYKRNDYDKPLALLSILIEDILSPSSLEVQMVNVTYCNNAEKLWPLITWGIRSKVEQYRKNACYVMKKIIEYTAQHRSLPTELKVVPFVYCQKYEQLSPVEKKSFFLILETLEEKQTHLVNPALYALPDLIKFSRDHLSCGNCCDPQWIACIFERILNHKTKSIVRTGVTTLLKTDANLYDDQLVSHLLSGLNNTFMYEISNNHTYTMEKTLTDFFKNARHNNVDLIRKFICGMPIINWAPIPLCYIFLSLNNSVREEKNPQINILGRQELESLARIMENNIQVMSEDLQCLMKLFIADVISAYTTPILNIEILECVCAIFKNSEHLIWNAVHYCMASHIRSNAADEYLANNCKKLLSSESMKDVNIRIFAATFVQLRIARILQHDINSPRNKVLKNVLDLLINAENRPCMNKEQYLIIVDLVTKIADYQIAAYHSHMEQAKKIFPVFLLKYLQCTANFIMHTLHSGNIQSLSDAEIYLNCIKILLKLDTQVFNDHSDLNTSQTSDNQIFDGNSHFKSLQTSAFEFICDDNKIGAADHYKLWFVLNMATLCVEMQTKKELIEIPDKFNDFIRAGMLYPMFPEEFDGNGKMVSDCYQCLAKLFEVFVKTTYEKSLLEKKISWVHNMKIFIDLGKEHVASSLIRTWQFLCNENIFVNDIITSADVKDIIDSSFTYLWDLKRDELYWSILNELLKLILHQNFLGRKTNDFSEITIGHMEKINEVSQKVVKIKYLILLHVEYNEFALFCFIETLLNNYLDTSAYANDKIKMQLYNRLATTPSIFLPNHYVDVRFRVKSLTIFIKVLEIAKAMNRDTAIQRILANLLGVLGEYEGKRYYEHSSTHRIKHRAMVLLLILYPFLSENQKIQLYLFIVRSIKEENNQMSVRIMHEWLLIKIYYELVDLRLDLWDLFHTVQKVRPGSIVSLASIAYHVCRCLPKGEVITYAEKAIPSILPGCMSQKFVVRLYCQVILDKIFELIDGRTFYIEYYIVKESLKTCRNYGNIKDNSLKLDKSYYLSYFHPLEDYTIHIILSDMPKILNMPDDECIPSIYLNSFNNGTIPLISNHRKLPSSLSFLKFSETYDCADSENTDNTSVDIQKKITPCTSRLVSDGNLSRISKIRQEKLGNDAGLIVVASLIDGMPNLGGLARTAEIFCVKELVLDSIKCTEKREFQTLCVSADKWIDITEVKRHALKKYLLDKSSMGWKLIGAEQTVNSVNIREMQFDKKTVLILGNEKSGIPADLIPLLNVCVEIPQAGVVRSLNVHVTGAICMWQYAQQHIF